MFLQRRDASRRWAVAAVVAVVGLVPVAAVAAPAAAAPASCPGSTIRPIRPVSIDAVSVALDGKGGFYLSSATGELSRIDIVTGATRSVATGLGNLRGVATDGHGTVYVADFPGRVLAVDAATGTRRVLAEGLGTLLGIAYAGGTVYAAGSGNDSTLWAITPGSAPRAVAGGLNAVADIAADRDGEIAVVELTGAVYRIDARTGARRNFDAGELYEPNSVQMGGDGRILFSTGAGELQAADPTTGAVTELCGSFPAYDFALDARGNAVVLDLSGNMILYVRHLAG